MHTFIVSSHLTQAHVIADALQLKQHRWGWIQGAHDVVKMAGAYGLVFIADWWLTEHSADSVMRLMEFLDGHQDRFQVVELRLDVVLGLRANHNSLAG